MAEYYPPIGFHFRIEFEISGVKQADIRFQEVSGLSMELETETINIGGENRYVQQLPTRAKYPDLVLKRGLLLDSGVIKWCRDAIENLDIKPANILVSILNEHHEPLQTYSFINAWPKKWDLSGFNAQQSGLLIETLEFAYQYFKKI